MDKKEFITASVGLAWHGWLFQDIHFMCTLWLEDNAISKLTLCKPLIIQ